MATGITESDVWTAADALLLEGARPTIERVRQKIGRGSPNTVSPYLETWFKALGARIRDPRAFASQEAVPDPVAQAAARLWDAALELARAEQAAAQRDAQAELAAQRQANADEAERLRQHAPGAGGAGRRHAAQPGRGRHAARSGRVALARGRGAVAPA